VTALLLSPAFDSDVSDRGVVTMVSRRTFLAGSGAVAAGGFGWFQTGSAAATGQVGSGLVSAASNTGDRRLLPAFARPNHLHYGDVSKLSGGDQTLLTTLQGVVNRSRPELYFLYSPGGTDGVDARWLRNTGVPTTRYAEPLDLVAKYKRHVRGAILHDPEVPDSLNVATTLAGLENAVVADAAQAKAHGLRVVKDLRGLFDDDRVKTYRWQLTNLFPRCSHQLLAGLPPTMVVQAENVTWREIARETRQIRDESNRGTFTLDVSPALGQGTCASRTPSATTAGARRCCRSPRRRTARPSPPSHLAHPRRRRTCSTA
jgi:hypothetical protein